MKSKKRFVCNECGYVSATWIGKCPECLSWNSFIEEIIENQKVRSSISISEKSILRVDEIKPEKAHLIITKSEEINNFFGEGLVAGSVVLLAGEPGVGKSTFLLFLLNYLSGNLKIYYFSGEESQAQIKKRYERVSQEENNLYLSNMVDVDSIIEQCIKDRPDIVFVDSIQTCYSKNIESSPGTISQIRYCTHILIQLAKEYSIPIIIIGHVTKSGDVAGPKVMEHMVDVVINLEGDYQHRYRILRSSKNRYGSTDELILFEMKGKGLLLIDNPSGYFIEKGESGCPGKCRSVTIEGRRPLIVEVEALVVPSVYSNPRRFAEGVDAGKVSRIAAILDKHLNENFNNYDIYFNISGGVKTKDVGIDLAIAMAIYSSKQKKVIDKNVFVIGELSLTGKIRNVFRLEQRVKEAEKFGADKILIPSDKIEEKNDRVEEINDINELVKSIF